jgi:hypothetical protein
MESDTLKYLPVTNHILKLAYKKEEPLGRSMDTWENNLKMNLKEMGCEKVGWIH